MSQGLRLLFMRVSISVQRLVLSLHDRRCEPMNSRDESPGSAAGRSEMKGRRCENIEDACEPSEFISL